MRKGLIGAQAMLGGAALLGLVLFVGVVKSCGWGEPIVLPDYADTLATVRQSYAADSAAWRAERRHLLTVADSALRRSETAEASARRTRVVRDTVRLAPTDTLVPRPLYEAVVVEAESLWAALGASKAAVVGLQATLRADSAAYERLASLRGQEMALFNAERAALRQMVVTARRGCRVLGLLPCPAISAGYGVTLAGGQLRTGPVLAVTIPVRF